MPKIRSLNWKLSGAIVLVVLVSLGLMVVVINWSISRQFENYVEQASEYFAEEIADRLRQFYSEEGDWSGVQFELSHIPSFGPRKIVVADVNGVIVGDTTNELIGKDIAETDLEGGIPIVVSGEEVGAVYRLPYKAFSGPGFPRSPHGIGPGSPPDMEQNFTSAVFKSLWITGLLATVLVLLVGFILTRQIIKPLYALKNGANKIASGDLNHRVIVKSKDELGELAQSFNNMAANLDMAEQSRRRLNADIAHEIRTPTSVILGTVDGIIDGVFEADHEHLSLIREQTILLNRITQDIRDLSMAESGQLKLELVPTSVVDLVKRKIAQYKARARNNNIKLELKVYQEASTISIDPIRIEQVITNLLANALHYTPSGGTVTVSIDTVTEDNDHFIDKPSLVISFADTGKGIEAKHLPHIFDRFYRADESRSRTEGGTGLGLAIVKQMVEAHSGQVWVESEPEKGSTFYISLPL